MNESASTQTDAVAPADKIDRIYLVTDRAGARRLIRAPNITVARAFATKTAFDVKLAKQDELIACTRDGIPVESIPAEPGAVDA